MSHMVRMETYEENVSKSKIQKGFDEWASQLGKKEGVRALNGQIRWINKTFNTYDDANKYIDKYYNSGSYEQVAVKYLEYPKNIQTKKFKDLNKKYIKCLLKYNEVASKVHYKNVKAQFVSCPNCLSKINRDFINSNSCPICHGEKRPKSTLEMIERHKAVLKDLSNQILEEKISFEQKAKKQAKVMWLVKVEAHC